MRAESWFDRTLRQKPRRLADDPNPNMHSGYVVHLRDGVEVAVVYCSGKCRKHAPDMDCKLHGRGARA